MRSRRHSLRSTVAIALGVLMVVLAACGSESVDDGDTSSTSSTTTTTVTISTTSSSTSTSTTSTTAGPLPQVTVSELHDLQFKQEVQLTGMLIASQGTTLVCEALAESFPPQCGGRWIVVTNPSAIDVDLTSEGDVSWSEKPVALTGLLVGGRFVLSGAPSGVEVTDEDTAIVQAFTDFVRNGGDTSLLPIAPGGLQLGLADRIFVTRSADELADPSVWDIDFEPFRGRVSPFSAHELLSDPREAEIMVGPHDHCAAPPWPVPEGFEAHRQVSVQPIRASSCIEWFTVDFFVNDDGLVEAITLDLWEP